MDFYGELTFCNDSVLRIKDIYKGKNVFYPITDLQNFLKEDASFILKLFRNNTVIEEGTTLANIILALEPWAKLIYHYIDRDVQAYCDACRKLSDKEQAFDFIEISRFSSINRNYIYDSRMEGESIMEYFNRETKRTATQYFNVETGTSMSGFTLGDNSNYSVSMAFNEIRNVPVVLATKQANYIYGEELLSDKDVDGLENHKKYSLFYSIAEYSLEEIIKSVFMDGLFYQKPMSDAGYEAFGEMLKESVGSISMDMEEEEEDNVVSLFPSENTENDNKEEDKKLKIKIRPGAFDAVIDQEMENEKDWELVFKKISSTAAIKTGELKNADRDISYRYEKFDSEPQIEE